MTDAARVAAISEALVAVRTRIERAGGASVRIVAVTKRHPVEVIVAAAEAGIEDLAENYAQEMLSKLEDPHVAALPVRWHFVGSLQTNKVKRLVPRLDLLQTLDRPSLVRAVARHAPGARVLVQVNLTGDEGRGGCSWGDAEALATSATEAGLDVAGLMGVGPHPDGDGGRTAVSAAFRRLADLRDSLGLAELSIGMTQDLEEAVEAGATMVRVGSALFGERPTHGE